MDVLDKIVRSILKLFKIRLSEKSITGLIQFIGFGIVGVTNTIISYVINVLVLLAMKPLHFDKDYFIANILAFIISVAWSFYWNNKYVFTKEEGETRSIFKSLIKTYISYAFTGIILSNILAYIWIDVLGISKYVAPLLNLVISVPLNFIINKFWAFRTNKKNPDLAEKDLSEKGHDSDNN